MSQSNNPPKELPYDPPTGRAGSTNGPGLGGSNHGNSGTQGESSPNRPIPGTGEKGPYR